ncbi:MAG: diacylglycerol kinase family protein [Caldimonas sp.]
MTTALVLLNPRAAGGRAAALRVPVAQWLARHAPIVPLVVTDCIEQAHATLRSLPDSSRVVAIGGDGTLHHLMGPAIERRHALALVPLGSGNDTARALGLFPMPWTPALQHALTAPAVAVDVGEMSCAHGKVGFVSSLCAGFDAAVCARTVAGPRWLGGMPRYLWATLRELAALRTWDLCVSVDGRVEHAGSALFASTCNTPTFGGGMPAIPDARIDDGRLDLLLAGAFGRAGALRMLPRLVAGTHLRDRRIATWGYTTLNVRSRTPIPLAADGEPLEAVAEFDVRIRASALAVVIGPGRSALARSTQPRAVA